MGRLNPNDRYPKHPLPEKVGSTKVYTKVTSPNNNNMKNVRSSNTLPMPGTPIPHSFPSTTKKSSFTPSLSTVDEKFDVSQTIYGATKDVWAYGKTVPVVSNILGIADAAAMKALDITFHVDYAVVDDKIKPQLKNLDDYVFTPVISTVWNVIKPIVGGGQGGETDKSTSAPKTNANVSEQGQGGETDKSTSAPKTNINVSEQTKKEATIAEITWLVSLLSLPKSADQLLQGYPGREDELLENLKKMKARKGAIIAEIEYLVSVLELSKSADELLASYKGREEELLENLKKMKARKEAIIAEVTYLVAVLELSKSADELLASYKGREEDLLENLKKMKARK